MNEKDPVYLKLKEAVKAIKRLSELVYLANLHPVTGGDNYPEYKKEADEIEKQFEDWWDIKVSRVDCDCFLYSDKCSCGLNAPSL